LRFLRARFCTSGVRRGDEGRRHRDVTRGEEKYPHKEFASMTRLPGTKDAGMTENNAGVGDGVPNQGS
jgi:hypothetical protein